MNNDNLEQAINLILAEFDDPNREGLKDTPKRVVKAYRELLSAPEPDITLFDSNGYDDIIVESGIEYYSLCEHHMLPFFGAVTIAYIPNKKIIGLSKLSRIVEYLSKRLNTQEYFTDNIADYINGKIDAKGVAVIVSGRHLCKEMRGAKKKGTMKTFAFRGEFLNPDKVTDLLRMI